MAKKQEMLNASIETDKRRKLKERQTKQSVIRRKKKLQERSSFRSALDSSLFKLLSLSSCVFFLALNLSFLSRFFRASSSASCLACFSLLLESTSCCFFFACSLPFSRDSPAESFSRASFDLLSLRLFLLFSLALVRFFLRSRRACLPLRLLSFVFRSIELIFSILLFLSSTRACASSAFCAASLELGCFSACSREDFCLRSATVAAKLTFLAILVASRLLKENRVAEEKRHRGSYQAW